MAQGCALMNTDGNIDRFGNSWHARHVIWPDLAVSGLFGASIRDKQHEKTEKLGAFVSPVRRRD